jgi:hypothetical protein
VSYDLITAAVGPVDIGARSKKPLGVPPIFAPIELDRAVDRDRCRPAGRSKDQTIKDRGVHPPAADQEPFEGAAVGREFYHGEQVLNRQGPVAQDVPFAVAKPQKVERRAGDRARGRGRQKELFDARRLSPHCVVPPYIGGVDTGATSPREGER